MAPLLKTRLIASVQSGLGGYATRNRLGLPFLSPSPFPPTTTNYLGCVFFIFSLKKKKGDKEVVKRTKALEARAEFLGNGGREKIKKCICI